jgi:hypothetical protein
MQSFAIRQILAARAQTDRAWLEFLRAGTLSVGIYHLKAGQPDPQRPHTEDEVYYAISGRASFLAGKSRRAGHDHSCRTRGRASLLQYC